MPTMHLQLDLTSASQLWQSAQSRSAARQIEESTEGASPGGGGLA